MDDPLIQSPRRRRLGELVAESVLRAIRLQHYLPGDRLPGERELTQRLAVGRAAVREAIRWLEQNGYVEVRRGKSGGAFVLPHAVEANGELLDADAAELINVLDFRSVVEPETAAFAARRIDQKGLAALREIAESMSDLRPRRENRALDFRFHEHLALASGNPLFLGAVREILAGIAPALDLVVDSASRRALSDAEHEQLLAALESGDAEAARSAMKRHIRASDRLIRRILSASGSSPSEQTTQAGVSGREPPTPLEA